LPSKNARSRFSMFFVQGSKNSSWHSDHRDPRWSLQLMGIYTAPWYNAHRLCGLACDFAQNSEIPET
jgi:hypothetical protein